MRWLWLSLLAIAGQCFAGPIEDYCNKPDVANPKLCIETMKGKVGKDWPDTSAPRTKSKVKTGRTKAPPLAAPSVQKWFKKLPEWPQTVDATDACSKSTFGKSLEAAIADENQKATQRALLAGAPTAETSKAKSQPQEEFAKFENDAELQQCLDPKAGYTLEDPYNLPHVTESLTVPLRAGHDQDVEACRSQNAQTCDGFGQCGPDPECELHADQKYDAALKGAVQKWLADSGPKYNADRDHLQACLNKLSAYHKAAVDAHNAGGSPPPSALGTVSDLNLIKGLADRVQAHCKAAVDAVSRPPDS